MRTHTGRRRVYIGKVGRQRSVGWGLLLLLFFWVVNFLGSSSFLILFCSPSLNGSSESNETTERERERSFICLSLLYEHHIRIYIPITLYMWTVCYKGKIKKKRETWSCCWPTVERRAILFFLFFSFVLIKHGDQVMRVFQKVVAGGGSGGGGRIVEQTG